MPDKGPLVIRGGAPLLLALAILLASTALLSAGAKSCRSAGGRSELLQQIGLEHDYLSEVSSDGLFCWPVGKLPVKVFFQPADGIDGYRSSYPEILAGCFDEWVRASEGKLGWTEVSQLQGADIVVRWTAQASERNQGTEAGRTKTCAQLNTLTNWGTIHSAEMTLLTRLPDREFSESEVKRAYLHEVGHAFGIAGHSSEPADIMFFAVRKNQSPHLSERDVATINHLYGGYRTLTSVVSHRQSERFRSMVDCTGHLRFLSHQTDSVMAKRQS